VPWTKLLQHRPTFPRGIYQLIVVLLDQSPWGRLAVGGHEGHHSKTKDPLKRNMHNTGNDLFKIRNRISNYRNDYRYLLASLRAWQLEPDQREIFINFHDQAVEKSILTACDNHHGRTPTQLPRRKPTVDILGLNQRLYFHVTDAPSYLDADRNHSAVEQFSSHTAA
jgi:hypothetical protein